MSAFLTGTTILPPNSTGYYVYLANLASATIPTSPQFTFSLNNFSGFANGSVSDPWATNAGGTLILETIPQSGAAVINGLLPPTQTPEPGSLLLFGTGLLGLAGIVRRLQAHN